MKCISQCSSEKIERKLYIYIYKTKFIIKYWHLPWRLRCPMICSLLTGDTGKLVSVQKPESQWCRFQLGSEGLRTRISEGRRQFPSSTVRQGVSLIFFHLFVLSKPSTDWTMPTHTGEGHLHLLSSVHPFKC